MVWAQGHEKMIFTYKSCNISHRISPKWWQYIQTTRWVLSLTICLNLCLHLWQMFVLSRSSLRHDHVMTHQSPLKHWPIFRPRFKGLYCYKPLLVAQVTTWTSGTYCFRPAALTPSDLWPAWRPIGNFHVWLKQELFCFSRIGDTANIANTATNPLLACRCCPNLRWPWNSEVKRPRSMELSLSRVHPEHHTFPPPHPSAFYCLSALFSHTSQQDYLWPRPDLPCRIQVSQWCFCCLLLSLELTVLPRWEGDRAAYCVEQLLNVIPDKGVNR